MLIENKLRVLNVFDLETQGLFKRKIINKEC